MTIGGTENLEAYRDARIAGAEIARRFVELDGRQVSYLTAGDSAAGATILLIHGSGVSARYWLNQLRGLGDALRILAIDLPGHGESDPIAAATVEHYADAARALLDVLGTGPVFVAGHSLGGAVAQALAGCAPDAVRGLILVATCARLPERADWLPRLLWWLPPLVRKAVFFSLAKKLLFAARAPQEAVLLGLEEIRTCRPETILKDVAAARAMNLEAVARGLRAPTLILCGREDRLTPLLLSQRLNELILGSRLVLVDGAAHMLPLEAPEQVNRAVLAFVESVAAGTLVRDAAAGAAKERSVLRRLLGWLTSPFRPRRP